jgi:hypothetical protein
MGGFLDGDRIARDAKPVAPHEFRISQWVPAISRALRQHRWSQRPVQCARYLLRDIALKLDLPEGSLVNGSGIKFTNFDWPDDPKDAGQNLRASIGVWQWTPEANEQVFPAKLATHAPAMVPLPDWSKR